MTDFESPDSRDMYYIDKYTATDGDAFVEQDDVNDLVAEMEVMGIDSREQAMKYFEENLPTAALAIVKIARNSQNDNTRLNAAKYIIERILGKPDVKPADKAAWELLLEDTAHPEEDAAVARAKGLNPEG